MSERVRVAITGVGVVSPLGRGVNENLAGLREGRDAVRPVLHFDVSKTRGQAAGQIDPQSLADCTPVRQHGQPHLSSAMMIAVAQELYGANRGFVPELAVIGTTSGGMSFGERFYRSLLAGTPHRDSAKLLASYPPQKAVIDGLTSAGWKPPVQIIANACASGTNAIGHAFSLVRHGICKSVLCGGYDAVSELVFAGFNALQAMTPELCRPFDKDRQGLVLGEGAALFALEAWDLAVSRGAPILGEVTGYGISTDNYHMTQPDPSGCGPQVAMERALASANRSGAEVDYINAHGTATLFNDATEGIAISNVCPEKPVSSTKAMTGHALGAAGAIEAAFVLLALREQFLPPNLHFSEGDPAWKFDIVANQARPATVRCALSNSFGFGGANATIILERA